MSSRDELSRAPAVHDPALTDPAAPTGRGPAPAPAASSAGGRYALGAEIARGGMGAVLRATDVVLDRQVAVKVLQERFGPDSSAARRFADEARITGRLQHPNIPAVHDLGELPERKPFLAMKLIEGDTLEDLLRARPEPSAERGRFVAVFEQVCQAVAYAHSQGFIHRDLKPGNVMVGAFGEVQVMDWGLAKALGVRRDRYAPGAPGSDEQAAPAADPLHTTDHHPADGSADRTQPGQAMGTPAYLPPEQARGEIDRVDRRSDVFALGGVLCAVLTGRPPHAGASAVDVVRRAAAADLADALSRLAGCGADPELVALCRRCLAAEPADRPADAGEVVAAVAALRAAADERARQAELQRARAEAEAREQRRRRRAQLALFAAVLALLVGGGAFAWWQTQRLGRNAEAVSALLDQAEEALRRGGAAGAGLALEAARKRAAEGGARGLAGRRGRLEQDLELLVEFDAIDRFRWTPQAGHKYPEAKEVAARYRAALAEYGADPDENGPAEAADRAAGSAVRDRLVEALDRLLAADRSPRVREALRAADPHEFRDAVRDAVLAGEGDRLAALAGRPEAAEQPAGFVAVLGENEALPVEQRRRLLGAAVAPRSGSAGLLMAMGKTYPVNQREGAEERVRWFQAAAAAAPENPAAHNNLGFALCDRRDLDGAVAACKEAIRLDPKYAVAHNNLGYALQVKGDLDGAVASDREAIRLDPSSAMAHHNLGCALQAKGDLDGAVASCKEVVRLDRKLARAHHGLGCALHARNDLDGAIASYRESIRLDPEDALARHSLGLALRARGDLDGAVASFEEVVRHDPRLARAHANLGLALQAGGDLDGAIACYREALRIEPRNELAFANLVIALRDRDDPAAAEAAFREAARLDPRAPWKRLHLAVVLRRGGDLAGAQAAHEEAVRLLPRTAFNYYFLGNFYRDRGLPDEAERAYREAVRLDGDRGGAAILALARLLTDRGDPDGAIPVLKRILQIDPTSAYALSALPRAERMRGLLPRLPDVLAGKAEPRTPAESCDFALLCARPFQKRYAAAVGLYEKAFADDPKLAADLVAAHRYNASYSAACAGAGEGADAPADQADRAALRGKALAWLRADLALRKRQAASASAADRRWAARALTYWLADSQLSGVRQPEALEKLPGYERRQWRKLWAEVKDALALAHQPPPPPQLLPPPLAERR